MESQAAQGQASGERRVELDWLRTIVVLGTIPFHAVPVIGAERAVFILSAEANPVLALLAGFVLTWGIPLIFLMAGAATRLALDVRTPGVYMRERIARLGVPLLLVALLFSPLQLYFILLSNPGLIHWLPRYGVALPILDPSRLRDFGYFYEQYLRYLFTSVRGYSPAIGSLTLTYLWFVPRLLAVSFLCLPFLLYLRGRGRRVTERVAGAGSHPVTLILAGGLIPALLIALFQPGWLSGVTAGWIFTDDWTAFFLDLVMFLYGFLIYSSERLRATVRTVAYPALALGVVCFGVVGALLAFRLAPAASFAPASLLFAVAEAFSVWLFILGLLGLAMRYLTVSTPWQRYLTAAAFPVFVLHGPLLAASSYYLLQVPVPGIAQLALILVVTVAGAFGVYEYVVRRTPVTRALFGAKAPRAKERA